MHCNECNKLFEFRVYPRRFCSKSCKTKQQHRKTTFSPLIKGHKLRLGIKHTEAFKLARIGSGNPGWKGDAVGYPGIHAWARKHYGKKNVCEMCKKQTRTEMSNKDHLYKREIDDWQELCRSCHIKYDRHLMQLLLKS